MLTHTDCRALGDTLALRPLADLARELSLYDRQPGGPDLDQLCQRLAVQLERDGAAEVELKSFTSGPGQRYFDWTFERPSRVEYAELWLSTAEHPLLLCRHADDPGTVVAASRSTPAEGEELELVEVGSGTRAADFRGRRIAGRAVLVSGYCSETALHETLSAREAATLLLGPAAADPRELAALVPAGRQRPFVFRLGEQAIGRLRHELARRPRVKVRVRATVTISAGELPLLRATLPGSDLARQRVLLYADLGRAPQALASAICAISAIARAVAAAKIAPPRRSIDLLLGAGPAAAIAWLANDGQRGAATRMALLLDLAQRGGPARELQLLDPPCWRPWFGVDLAQQHFAGDPASVPGRPDNLPRLRRVSRPAQYHDPFVVRDVDIPTVVLRTTAPLATEALPRLAASAAATIVDFAGLGEPDLPLLIDHAHVSATQRLGRLARGLQQDLARAAEIAPGEARHLLWRCEGSLADALQREQLAVRSCGEYLGGGGPQQVRIAEVAQDLQRAAEALQRALHSTVSTRGGAPPRGLTARRPRLTALQRRAESVVVERRFAGPPPLLASRREASRTDRGWIAEHAEALREQPIDALLQVADGRANLRELVDRLRFDHPTSDLRLIWRYLEVLQRAKLVRLREI